MSNQTDWDEAVTRLKRSYKPIEYSDRDAAWENMRCVRDKLRANNFKPEEYTGNDGFTAQAYKWYGLVCACGGVGSWRYNEDSECLPRIWAFWGQKDLSVYVIKCDMCLLPALIEREKRRNVYLKKQLEERVFING